MPAAPTPKEDEMSTDYPWFVDDLQAVEPGALSPQPGIKVSLHPEKDSMEFDRATVSGPTREAVVEYVRLHWGDEDADWFKEWVEDRVQRVPEENGMEERTILLHLNITLDRADERDVDAIEAAVMGALEVGLDPDHTNLDPSQVVVAMAEEI